MGKVKPIEINDFTGGLNLNDDTTIEDNQLSLATNMFYDDAKRLVARRGIKNFGAAIPDTAVVINNCNAVTDYAATDDAANILQGTAIRGTNSVEFDIDVSASAENKATLTNASIGTIDCSSANGFLKFWLYVPASFNTNLTAVKIQLGSDSSNYHEWTLETLTEASNNFINLDFDDATDTGTPDDSSVDYFRLQVTYTAGYTDKLNLLIDSINCYSSTNVSGVHSLKFWKDSTGIRRLIAGCSTSIFQYDETTSGWEMIKNGLTDNLPLGDLIYTDVLYLSNGTDNYLDYNGTLVTERTGGDTQKPKYMLAANDVGYCAGVSGTESILYYTGSAPAEMYSYGNTVDIQEDDGQVITGLTNLGPIVIVYKDNSAYDVNIATPSREQLDYSGGCKSHRSISRVENDVLFLDKNGVYSLAQREGTTGSLRATPLTKDLQPLIDVLRNQESSAAIYWEKTNQYYLAVDTNNAGFNDSVLVYDALVKGWTRYNGINANEFCIYEDSDGIEHVLFASEYGGNVVEMETGFSDNELPIATAMSTKDFNFNAPSLSKEYREIDVVGFISESAELTMSVIIDDEEVATDTINGSNYAGATESIEMTFGVAPFGVYAFTGGDIVDGELQLNLFKARFPVYQTGVNLKVKITSGKANTSYVISKMQLVPEAQPFDFFPNNEIL